MPLVDLPLAELERYEGRNPRPADFDAYWDAALAESAALPLNARRTPAAFSARGVTCEDLRFDGTRGGDVYAKLLIPERPTGAAVVCFHGYSMNSGDWIGYLPWVQQGLVVAAMDCRGQGGRSHDGASPKGWNLRGHIVRGLDDPDPHNLYYRNVYLDTARLAGYVVGLPEVDPARVGASGGSQGGGLTLACAALEPRVSRIAPVYPFLCDYRRVWEMDLAANAYDELKTWFRHFDPRHEREDAVFERLGYVDCAHLAPRIRADTLLGVGLMDTICPPSTYYAAYNRIPAPKRALIYPDFGHEGLPGFNDEAFAFLTER